MSEDTYTTTQIAKELGMGAPTLNERLRRLGVQYKQNGQWLLMHRHQNKGYAKTHTHTFTHSNGQQGSAMQTVWTEKGRAWIHGLIANA
jgi:anti-repressor protein